MKRIFTALSLLVFAFATQAQITLDQSDFAQNGSEYPLAADYLEEPVPFADFGWDFSDLGLDYIDTTKFIDPQLTEYAEIFPEANMMMNEGGGMLSFLVANENEIKLVGLVGDFIGFGEPMVFALENPMIIMQFPTTVGTTFSQEIVNTIKFPYSEIQLVDSISIDLTLKLQSDIVDYGTVTTPYGDYEALKEWSQNITLVDNLQVYTFLGWIEATGDMLEGLPIEFPISDTVSVYNYLAKDQGLPLVTATLDLQENVRAFSYQYQEEMAVYFETTDVVCNGANTGEICATVAGGTPPYTYAWSEANGEECIQEIPAGEYTLTITDADENTFTNTAVITEPEAIVIESEIIELTEAGNDGAIDISVTGGVAPYTFLWTNGSTTEDIADLEAGDYSLAVTDANSCVVTDVYSLFPVGISDNDLTQFAVYPNPVKDNLIIRGVSNSQDVQVFDLHGSMIFESNASNQMNVANLQSGIYVLKIIDNKSNTQKIFRFMKE